jgi:hypothetical protein
VSCPSLGNCEAGGGYEDDTGEQVGVLANESDGVWGQGTGLTLPADAGASPQAASYISSVICTSVDSCDAGGAYETNSGSFSSLFLSGVPSLGLAGQTLPSATAGVAYTATLDATGGTGNDAWSITSGSLPAGLNLNASTGVISGTPTTAKTSTFTIVVSDGGPPTQTASGTFSLTVAAPKPGRTVLRSVVLKHDQLKTTLSCVGTIDQLCHDTLTLSIVERWRGRKLVAVAAASRPKLRSRTIVLAKGSFHSHGRRSGTVTTRLNATGRKLHAQRPRFKARLTVDAAGNRSVLLKRTVQLKR